MSNESLAYGLKMCVCCSPVGVGTQWSAAGNQARQMLRGDVHCRPRDHHRTLTGMHQQTLSRVYSIKPGFSSHSELHTVVAVITEVVFLYSVVIQCLNFR